MVVVVVIVGVIINVLSVIVSCCNYYSGILHGATIMGDLGLLDLAGDRTLEAVLS